MLPRQTPPTSQWILLLPKQPGSNNCDNCEFGTNACNEGSLHHGSEDDDTTLDATLSTDESEESSSLSEGDSSRSSESEDFEESEEVNLQQENETSQSQEEPLYQGSKISKILSFVLIVSFVLKHNLSKAAWADLLRLLTVPSRRAVSKNFSVSL